MWCVWCTHTYIYCGDVAVATGADGDVYAPSSRHRPPACKDVATAVPCDATCNNWREQVCMASARTALSGCQPLSQGVVGSWLDGGDSLRPLPPFLPPSFAPSSLHPRRGRCDAPNTWSYRTDPTRADALSDTLYFPSHGRAYDPHDYATAAPVAFYAGGRMPAVHP